MTHNLDDDLLVTPALNARLCTEADLAGGRVNSPWWVGAERSNGKFTCFSAGYKADIGEKLIAEQLIKTANKEVGHDGAWIGQWCNSGFRFNMLWMDEDGDVQFTIETDDDAGGICNAPLLHWITGCADAWGKWNLLMRKVLAPSKDQLYKRALGQKRPSLNNGRPINGKAILDEIVL